MRAEPSFSVSEFVAVLNQTLEYVFASVSITGELANFRISKNKWVYFDLKDDEASVRFFGTVYMLPGPLEDGMLVQVRGIPKLHQQFGFSITVQTIQPVGEGSIRRAADLLQAKLAAEGLFDEERKRFLPYPPERIGLVTSSESAAYADFTKILNARWRGMTIDLVDVQVQGEAAPAQIIRAIEYLNQSPNPPEVIIVTRGGGSAEDLQAFSTEAVTRAVAASRVPTLVAIGHEVDTSLAELAADKRASTPSNAAELLVPDRKNVLQTVSETKQNLQNLLENRLEEGREYVVEVIKEMSNRLDHRIAGATQQLVLQQALLSALNPEAILRRGYAIVKKEGKTIRDPSQLNQDDHITIKISKGEIKAKVE